jgi:2-haloacid dehalogenase
VSVRIAAIVFDLYGTLLAIDSMRMHVAAAGVRDPGPFVAEWRRKQLEYSFLTTLANVYRDFDELTADALAFTCAQLDVALPAAVQRALTEAWRTMPAYGDVAIVLRALAAKNIPLAVLTNGTPSSANTALEHAGVRALLTDVLSVDSVRAYKPDPRVYALATARFECAPGEIVFVSSNAWDAWGAATFGFRVAWCNRGGNPAETLTPAPETTLAGLHELPAFVARAE